MKSAGTIHSFKSSMLIRKSVIFLSGLVNWPRSERKIIRGRSFFSILFIFLLSQNVFSQITENDSCHKAFPFCGSGLHTYAAGVSPGWGTNAQAGPDYGCLGFQPNPAWYFMRIESSGDIIIRMESTPLRDIDYICWGPFTSPTEGCISGLTSNKIVDCSYSLSATEVCTILNAQSGAFYMLLITNYSNQPCDIAFSQTNIGQLGAGKTDCDIVSECSIFSLSADTTSCNSTNGHYNVNGVVEFSSSPASGLLTLTDITAVPPKSQIFSAPFVSPQPYFISNLLSDGKVHTIKAAFSDSAACTFTNLYTAPKSICPVAVISGGGHICNNGTDQASVNVNITQGVAPFNFTLAINGVPQTPITNYNGPFPYQVNISIPGNYTLVSVSDAVCSGIVAGSAVVNSQPVPVPVINGPGTACAGISGNVYSTQPGMVNYTWTISAGGTITDGGNTGNNAVTVTWNTSGSQYVKVRYTDPAQCSNEGQTDFPVSVNAFETASVSINADPAGAVYTGTRVTFTATPVNGGSSPSYQWKKNNINIIGANGSAYSSTSLSNADVITVEMVSDAVCLPGSNTSNPIVMVVNPIPSIGVNIEASPAEAICPGTSVLFTATTDNQGINPEYKWVKNGMAVGENLPTYLDSTLVDQDVICCTLITNLKDAGTITTRSKEIKMTVYYTKARFTITENFSAQNGNILLNNTSTGADSYYWDFGNGQTSTEVNPSITYMQDGTYRINLIAINKLNCTDSFSYKYAMLFKGLYIPNAFAPNATTTLGSVFKPAGVSIQRYKIEVYDNSGHLMWESSALDEEGAPTESWDGTYNGRPMPQGTYLWKAHAIFLDDTAWKGSDIGTGKTAEYGTVLLIR
jgi:PKD repeat protein